MAGIDRWVVVDSETPTIVGGPYLWDGESDWEPPQQGHLMTEADAFTGGYQYPAEEAP